MRRRRVSTEEQENMTIRLIKIAAIYLVIGMTLGVGMGISHNFLFRSVHAHINLLGWASIAVAALVFHVFPDTARTRLATAWFWTYNLSVPLCLAALALVISGHTWAAPALVAGELGIWSSGVIFAVNLFWALRSKELTSATLATSPASLR
jgi:FtsH-binding integral membrane protein